MRKCWATCAGSRLKRILLLSSFTFSMSSRSSSAWGARHHSAPAAARPSRRPVCPSPSPSPSAPLLLGEPLTPCLWGCTHCRRSGPPPHTCPEHCPPRQEPRCSTPSLVTDLLPSRHPHQRREHPGPRPAEGLDRVVATQRTPAFGHVTAWSAGTSTGQTVGSPGRLQGPSVPPGARGPKSPLHGQVHSRATPAQALGAAGPTRSLGTWKHLPDSFPVDSTSTGRWSPQC